MVKSGEVYYSEELNVEDGFLFDQDSRPRNICVPSSNGCGLLTALQSVFWTPIKKFISGFI